MPAASAATARLLLFADPPRAVIDHGAKVRRYRLARLPLDSARRAGDPPRYDYLKRSYD